jgi:uncharacterized OsmC-like protein
MAEDPKRIGGVTAKIFLMKEVNPDLGQGILRMVKHCTVHNTLMTPPKIEISLSIPRSANIANLGQIGAST